ncbi:MAG: hypothetical protein PHU65_07485 [Actinomycetota bacterium]|nr:hypothetical protein [Actinomycetota bacterium]
MSCYFRHMNNIFKELDIEITKENKKEIDRILHKIVEIEYKNCPDAWKKIKEIIKGGDEEEKTKFILLIKEEIKPLKLKEA